MGGGRAGGRAGGALHGGAGELLPQPARWNNFGPVPCGPRTGPVVIRGSGDENRLLADGCIAYRSVYMFFFVRRVRYNLIDVKALQIEADGLRMFESRLTR